LSDQIVAAMDICGVEGAFRFLKQLEPGRRAAERELERNVQEALDEFAPEALAAVEEGQHPDYNTLEELLQSALIPFFMTQFTEETLRVSGEMGIAFDPAMVNQQAAQWARQHAGELIKDLAGTTREAVGEIIATFIESPGMTQGDLVKLLEKPFGEVRSKMIATTETTQAYSAATTEVQQLMAEAGVQMTRIWHTRNDERVCPICGPLDGTPESVWGQQFPNGPPAHPNCRGSVGLSQQPDAVHIREAIRRGKDRIVMLKEEGMENLVPGAEEALRDLRARL
jgi:SPP1 gp7 family putative phage head morphogenesis protein